MVESLGERLAVVGSLEESLGEVGSLGLRLRLAEILVFLAIVGKET